MAFDEDTFYDKVAQETKLLNQKRQLYIDMALEQGDIPRIEKPGEVIIQLRIKKAK